MTETTTPPVDPPEDDPVTVADKPREPTEYEKRLRRENANTRTRLREVEAKAASDLDAATAEAEARVTAANAAAEQRLIRAELKASAIKAGMVDLDGLKLLDLSKVKLTEGGDVEGAEALLAAAKEAKPWLFGAPGASSSSAATPPPSTPPATKLARDMTPEEWQAARKAAIAKR